TKHGCFLYLLLVDALSIGLALLNHFNWTLHSGHIPDFIAGHPSAVSLIIQIISSLLGFIYISVCSTIINLMTRVSLEQNGLSLDSVKFRSALVAQSLDTSLPYRYLWRLFIFCIFALVPSALWASAITPVPTMIIRDIPNSLQTPGFQNISWVDLNPSAADARRDEVLGIFTFAPAWYLQGLILDSAAGATSRTGGNITRPKLDKTTYSYVNRSYGVGSVVGLADDAIAHQYKATKYSFMENGFETQVSCIYNQSSRWGLVPSDGQPDFWYLHVFEAFGWLPNSPNALDYTAATMLHNPAIVALASDTSGGQNYFGITTDADNYVALNNTQCQVLFTQKEFSVDVDVLNRTITVNPKEENTWLTNQTTLDRYTDKIIGVPYDISTSLSTSLYVNGLGNAILANVENVQYSNGMNAQSNLTGLAAALTSIMDDAMVAFGSAQIMLANDTAITSVRATSSAYAIGTLPYIYAVVTLSLLTSLIYSVTWLRTNGWRGLSKFDFMDIKSVIVAASKGGTAIAD
ncbi:hypothetical protein F5884DRAFT_631570, partial [Xylogone sp. PMI_703]